MQGIQVIDVPVHWVNEGEKRLDACFYAQDVIKARVLLERVFKKIKVEKLLDLVNDVFMPALKITIPFYDEGEEYLTQSEVEFFLPKARKRVNVNKIEDVERWKVKSGYLLISQSGSIGRITIATKYLEQFIISPNPIRVVVDNNLRGYIYAFLSSWIGQALIKSPQYGITVKHILPHHLYGIPIPRIPDLEEEVNQKILETHQLREEAQELLLKAEKMIYSELKLPEIDEDNVEYFGGKIGKLVKSFEVKASELDCRLDASYHAPLLRKIKKYLSSCKCPVVKLGSIVDRIFIPPRFKRPYVRNPDNGVPFLQGTHIPMIRPRDVKYIWKKMENIEQILLKKHWILMTRSGTVGRIGLVSDYLNGWAASEHILRILVKSEVNPGYVVAFLSSPYGEHQIKGKIYGAVVDEIAEQDTSLIENIDILLPDKNTQDRIGSLVIEAYNKKDKANQIEEEAIKKLEETLQRLAD